jgi:hypothetical protein
MTEKIEAANTVLGVFDVFTTKALAASEQDQKTGMHAYYTLSRVLEPAERMKLAFTRADALSGLSREPFDEFCKTVRAAIQMRLLGN